MAAWARDACWGACLVALLLPIGGAAAPGALFEIEAHLVPRDHVDAVGAIVATGEAAWLVARGLSPSTLAANQDLVGSIIETRWQTLASPAGGDLRRTESQTETRDLPFLRAATLATDAAQGDASVAVLKRMPADRLSSSAAHCRIADAESEPFHGGGTAPPPRREPWEPRSREVRADCDAALLNISGSPLLVIHGTLVRLESGQPDDRELREILTGVTESPNATLPGVIDHVDRVLHVGAGIRDVEFRIHAATNWTLHSEALAAMGRLRVPPSRGDLSWGEWAVRDPADPLAFGGIFDLSAPDVVGIRLQGYSPEAPPGAPVPVAGPTSKTGFVVGMLVAAAGATMAAAWRGPLSLVALFTRLTEETTLGQARRRAILDAIRENPGFTLKDLAMKLGLPRRAVQYHVGVLAARGWVTVSREGRRAFVRLAHDTEGTTPIRLASSRPPVQAVVAALGQAAAHTHEELARRTGLARRHVSKILARLTRLGLVAAEGPKGARVYRLRRPWTRI